MIVMSIVFQCFENLFSVQGYAIEGSLHSPHPRFELIDFSAVMHEDSCLFVFSPDMVIV